MSVRPYVSIAMPLHRSARFVENIASNIGRLDRPDLEILISDRHLADGALDELAARHRDDPRVRILRRGDEADWITHYNDLLREARGTYFCWMPHDDVYAAGYVTRLAAALDAEPRALLAFGVMDAEAAPGARVPVGPFTLPPLDSVDGWSTDTAVRLLLHWELFRVVRGLVRRDAILARGLLVPRTHETVQADVCWAFAVAVAGPLIFVPEASCTKRYQVSSASAAWRYGVREALSEWRVTSASVRRHARSRDAVRAIAVLTGLAVLRVGWRVSRSAFGRAATRVP